MAKSVLFFCPGQQWSTIERTAIRDCLAARQSGLKVVFCCSENSPLDIKTEVYGFEKVYFKSMPSSNLLHWGAFRKIEQTIIDREIDTVHNYGMRYLWPICYYLRGHPLIPVAITVNKELLKSYRKVWFRPLLTRLDKVFIPSSDLLENIWGQMWVHPRKCSCLGMGIPMVELFREGSTTKKSLKRVGIYISPAQSKIEYLDFIFKSLEILIGPHYKSEVGDIEVIIYLDRELSNTFLSDNIRGHLAKFDLKESVSVVKFEGLVPAVQQIDLWISPHTDEELEDMAINALLTGCAVLLPRKASTMGLVRRFEGVGETYKRGDSRDFRVNCLKILSSVSKYHKKVHSCHKRLAEAFSDENYGEKLKSSYLSLTRKRELFFKRKGRGLGIRSPRS
jgi:hypothetical protein